MKMARMEDIIIDAAAGQHGDTLESFAPGDVPRSAPRPSRRRLLASLALGAILGLGLVMADAHLPRFTDLQIALFLVSWPLAIAVHEAGHAIAAHLLRFRIQAAGVLWFAVFRTRTSWRLKVPARSGLEGFIAAYPLALENLRLRDVWLVAAGPVASFVAFLICASAQYYTSGWINTISC
jgi:hypothetical protein